MSTMDPEKRGKSPGKCFPISREAASAVFPFLAAFEDHLIGHRQIIIDLLNQNRTVFDVLVGIGKQWGLSGEKEIGFTGGMALGYRALQEQAERSGTVVPLVSDEVANTYVADLNQDPNPTAGPYLLRRSDELEFEDPYYFEVLRTALTANAEVGTGDQGYMACMAGVMLYDMVKKQTYADELRQQFEM